MCWQLTKACLALSSTKNVRNLFMSNSSEETFLTPKILSLLEIKGHKYAVLTQE